MRQALTGIRTRSRFRAYLAGISASHNIILENLITPNGIEPHVWVPRVEWPINSLLIGNMITFEASVRIYGRGDGSGDLGLCAISDVELVR